MTDLTASADRRWYLVAEKIQFTRAHQILFTWTIADYLLDIPGIRQMSCSEMSSAEDIANVTMQNQCLLAICYCVMVSRNMATVDVLDLRKSVLNEDSYENQINAPICELKHGSKYSALHSQACSWFGSLIDTYLQTRIHNFVLYSESKWAFMT